LLQKPGSAYGQQVAPLSSADDRTFDSGSVNFKKRERSKGRELRELGKRSRAVSQPDYSDPGTKPRR